MEAAPFLEQPPSVIFSAVMVRWSTRTLKSRQVAALNHDKAMYLKNQLEQAGVQVPFDAPVFNEFVVRFEQGFEQKYRQLLSKKMIAGWPLDSYYPELPDHYLLSVTETKTKEQMDDLVKEVAK